ncbi:PREDICTED: probable aminopeptidase NPEPL1 [Condylura cristata]|uniref:probable aminopeptidase NPEPL1 n=1 Tax=Condylura cristata TaxID=143302 RepID=UPI000642A6A4|nr:PREDICTED: probable aminopeptidase NPEPL1 [Condylura cristata]
MSGRGWHPDRKPRVSVNRVLQWGAEVTLRVSVLPEGARAGGSRPSPGPGPPHPRKLLQAQKQFFWSSEAGGSSVLRSEDTALPEHEGDCSSGRGPRSLCSALLSEKAGALRSPNRGRQKKRRVREGEGRGHRRAGQTTMPGMKRDCGGAAAVLGAFRAAIKQGFKDNLHAVFCLAENSVGPNATRPDDILTLYSGKTVEVNNTDAEGRLVLADGVSYACKDLGADIILDMATLTGAQGERATGFGVALLLALFGRASDDPLLHLVSPLGCEGDPDEADAERDSKRRRLV